MRHIERKNTNCAFIDNFDGYAIGIPKKPNTTIHIGENPGMQIDVDKKFNWFQKKMIKWCFGFDVKENK
jgi:hypothetical protein